MNAKKIELWNELTALLEDLGYQGFSLTKQIYRLITRETEATCNENLTKKDLERVIGIVRKYYEKIS